jgi:hypothetical protein
LIERLELLRGNRSQKEFAEWLEESPTTVNGYFTGSSRPKIEFLRSLAAKNVNLNWFITGDGPVYNKEPLKKEIIEQYPSLLGMKNLTDQFIGKVSETIEEYNKKSKELKERKKTKK